MRIRTSLLNSLPSTARLILVSCIGFASAAGRADPSETVALQIGEHKVSAYLVDKYYRRYAGQVQEATRHPPSADESLHWFEQFVARQTIIAHAASLGYFDRPEVRAIVARMERYRLTSPSGELYTRLAENDVAPSSPGSEENPAGQIIDCSIMRFNGEDEAEGCLGRDFPNLPLQEQRQCFLRAREAGTETFDGPTRWPYIPFAELAPTLPSLTPGAWIKSPLDRCGVYYIFVRSVTAAPTPPLPPDVRRSVQKDIRARLRRVSVLASSHIAISVAAARAEYQLIKSDPGLAGPATEHPPGFNESDPLFAYGNSPRETVSLGSFARYYRELFVRQVPRSFPDFCRLVENMLLEQQDVILAREMGLDKTPRFTDDRRGFAGFQALELYEKEVLIPQISISQEAIEYYYRSHREQFIQIKKIRVGIARFGSEKEALTWLRERQADAAVNRESSPAVPLETIEVAANASLPILQGLEKIIFQSAAGVRFGPFPSDSHSIAFERLENVESHQASVAEAADWIRETLTRGALDTREIEHAQKLALQHPVTDGIDYSAYGLPNKRSSPLQAREDSTK